MTRQIQVAFERARSRVRGDHSPLRTQQAAPSLATRVQITPEPSRTIAPPQQEIALDAARPVPAQPSKVRFASVTPAECYQALQEHGLKFKPLDRSQAPGVDAPVLLQGDLNGLRLHNTYGPEHSETASIMDCRLLLALALVSKQWQDAAAQTLHFSSAYRPHAHVKHSRNLSGHAKGLAIDITSVQFENGTTASVEEAWQPRMRKVDPCSAAMMIDAVPLRNFACSAANAGIFQLILTPHYDTAHANHLHFEVRPAVDWKYIR